MYGYKKRLGVWKFHSAPTPRIENEWSLSYFKQMAGNIDSCPQKEIIEITNWCDTFIFCKEGSKT